MKTRFKQLLFIFMALILILGITIGFTNATNNKSQGSISTFKVNPQKIEPKDLTKEVIKGEHFGKLPFGVFTTNARTIWNENAPNLGAQDIQVFPDPTNNIWVGGNKEYHDVEINVLDYATSKQDFLNKYKYVTANVMLMDNFWNTHAGWSYGGGADRIEFAPHTFNITLTGGSNYTTLWNNWDYSGKEGTDVKLHETWFDNKLVISWQIQAIITWSWGSWIAHASVIKLMNAEFGFRSTEKFVPLIPDEINHGQFNGDGKMMTTTFDFSISGLETTGYGSSNKIETFKIFDSLKTLRNNDNYREAAALSTIITLMASGKYNDTYYTAWTVFTFGPKTLFILDQTLALNNDWGSIASIVLNGKLEFNINANGGMYSSYTNSTGAYQTSNIVYDWSGFNSEPRTWIGYAMTTYYAESYN